MGRFERNRNFYYNRHDDEFKLNVDIPNFNGDLNIEGCFVLISMPNSIPKRRNYGRLAL